MTEEEKTRCEGWRRRGGAFTLGPVTWAQCDNDAVVMITAKQKGEDVKTFPACMECWNEALQFKIEILEVVPL